MTQDSKKPLLKGEAALAELRKCDERIKSYRPTTWDVTEGIIVPTGEVVMATWKNDRTGQSGEYPCFRCKDSANKTHDVALTALTDKDPILNRDGSSLNSGDGLFRANTLPTDIFNGLLESIKTKDLYLSRYYGKRRNFLGNYEVFSLVEKPAAKTKNK